VQSGGSFGATRFATDVGGISAALTTYNPCALTWGGPGCWGNNWGWSGSVGYNGWGWSGGVWGR
jgi:hypothetical protein